MKLWKSHGASSAPIETIPADATLTYKVGEGLVITSNKAAKATGETAPAYICVGPAKDGNVPVIKMSKEDIYAAPLGAAGTSLNVGDKVTVDTDSIKLTAATTKGVAEIVGFATAAKAAGDEVYFRI